MKQFLRYILPLVAILMASGTAWAISNAEVTVISEPNVGGSVAINSSNSATDWGTNKSNKQEGGFWAVNKNFTFYRFASAASGYTFKGWSTSQTANSGETNSQFTAQGGGAGTEYYKYYAIFATLQSAAHNTTVQFNDTKVDEQSSKSITIKHSHAGTVALSLSGTNAGDFSLSETSFTSTSYQEGRSVTIYFKPTCAGERTATLTISSNNGLSSLTVYLKGNALRHTPTNITWQEPIDVNMFVGDTRTIKANPTTDGSITYSSSNTSSISVSGNTLTAKAKGTAIITATQAATCKYNAVSITKTFTVNNKKTPTFWLNGDPNQLTDNLKTEDTRTITITNVDESMTADYNPNLLSYTFNGSTATIKALDAGTATLKLTQPETSQIFYGDRTFTFYITKYDTNTITNDLATNYMVDDVVAEADIYTINNHEVPVEIISGNNNVLKFENGQLKAVGAGTTTLTVKQSATNKWVERTATKTITVHKYDITASINPDNAVWNQLVTPNPFSASTQHKFFGATSAVTDFTVTQQNNEHIAKLNNTKYTIQTYYTNGDVNFLITRPEDYKYNALNQTLTLHVNQSGETCNLITDETANVDHSTGQNSNGTYSKIFTLNGIGDKLIFKYYLDRRADYNHYVTPQYSTTDTGDNFNDITTRFTTQSTTPTSSDSITLPVGTKRIRFKRTAATLGTKNVLLSNITVTRAKSLTPSDSLVILPVTSIGTPETKTFTLKWSTCADEILLTKSNPHFTINTHNISSTAGQGSTAITVTCDASVVGTLRDTIVIYDQTQRIFVPVVCEVNDKFIANIKGTTAYSKKVDDTWVADFKFDTCQTALPSADINAPFYYTIDHDLTGNDVQNPEYKDQVISYNPQNYTITAHNAGTAILTFIQKPTISHYTDTFRCVITVSKYDAELNWKDPVYYNDTISNYFTTTDTISPIVIESETDTDVAKLTKTTSNNSLDLITFNKEASTIVTISQAENYKWNGYSIDHTIKPIDQNNHVTFTLTQENYISAFKHSFVDPAANDQSKGPDWQSGGIYFGGEGAFEGAEGWNWNEKYYIIQFTGIPDSIYFDASRSGAATGTIKLSVSEGKTPDNLTEVWSNSNNSENNKIIRKLNPDSRYLKFSYTGNLWGLFKNITVTELNQFEAVPNVLDFGLQYVDNPETTKSFDFKFANAGYKVHLQSTDTMFTVATTYIDTIGGEKYGTIKDIQVSYRPTHVHNTNATGAKIIIWDEAGNRDTVFIKANTIKSKPTLHWTEAWKAKKPIVLLNQTVTNAAESTNGYSTVKYISNKPDIIKVSDDGTSFQGVGLGEAIIIAYQDSDRVYEAPEPIQKTFLVTDKRLQYILWEDNLTDFCIDDERDTLRAQVWVMTDAANGTWEYSPEQTAKLQYSSPNVNIATVADSILTIHGLGEMFLTATVPADTTYEMASAQIPVRVRDCSVQCTDADLVIPVINANGTVMMPEDKLEYDPYALWDSEKIVAIDTTAGIPGHLIFAYYGRQAWGMLEGKIRVWESTDGGNNWQQILSDADAVKPLHQQTQHSPYIPLSRNATHIKFERFPALEVKLGYHIIQYITITPAQYIESIPDDIDFGNVYLGNTVDTTIAITYSSIRSNLHLASSYPSHLTIDKTTIEDECGAWDTIPLTITLKADIYVVGPFSQYVTVSDPISGITDTIHITANIVKNTPTITWNTTDTIRSSAEWETKKTAISSSGDLVLYELTAGNLPEEFAYLNDAGKMILLRGGWITARAYTAETTTSNEVSAYHDFFIVVDPLFQDFDNDGNWLNDNNWNIGRIPWTTDSATIAANKHVSLDTVIITEGLSFESGGSIHITSTGGLTVGAQGIQGAATDGSSIVIDNLKTGAGFLRISPAYQGTMPRTTVNYQTRSTLDTGANRDATWQYFGAPGKDVQFTVDGITWLYQWSEPQNWINKTGTLTLEPFAGYAITQYGKPTYALSAEAITSDQAITLTKTESGMNGNNLFANSYMAPIDAKNFTPEDFSDYNTGSEDIVKTFYIFNSGSWNEWNKYDTETSKGSNGNDVPGQYCAVPAFSSKYMDGAEITTLPPMQGIYVIANTNGAQIHLNYDKHVWNAGTNPNVSTDMHEPMRTPQRLQAEEQMQQDNFRRIRIQLNSANSGADRLYIIQTDETTPLYDNGYDAPNQTVSGLTNIYTTESFGKMEVSCSNRIDSMYIGFQAGSDTQYTLSFSSLIGDMLYLEDLEQDTIVAMQQDMPYTFSATPLTINDHRFRLLLYPEDYSDTPNTPTDTDPADNIRVWLNNNVLHIIGAPANSTLHIYNISGAHIFTQIISDTPYTYNLSHLSASVYLVRINNYTYKVITK